MHYLNEKVRLEDALKHVEAMLVKLGAPTAHKPALTRKGKAPKKRGPKSVWGAFIVKRLRARNRPMSYDELIADAMSIHKIPDERHASAKASILNSAFRLRTVHGKIVTVGRPGKKDKLVVLTKVDHPRRCPLARTRQVIQIHHGWEGRQGGRGFHSSKPLRGGGLTSNHTQQKRAPMRALFHGYHGTLNPRRGNGNSWETPRPLSPFGGSPSGAS